MNEEVLKAQIHETLIAGCLSKEMSLKSLILEKEKWVNQTEWGSQGLFGSSGDQNLFSLLGQTALEPCWETCFR